MLPVSGMRSVQRGALDQHPEGWCPAYLHELSCTALAVHPCKGPREATPRTRSPAPPPLDRRPQLDGETHAAEDFSSCNPSKGTLNRGPRRVLPRLCRRPAPPSASGVFIPRREKAKLNIPWTLGMSSTGTRRPPWRPTADVRPGRPCQSITASCKSANCRWHWS